MAVKIGQQAQNLLGPGQFVNPFQVSFNRFEPENFQAIGVHSNTLEDVIYIS